MPVLTPLWGWFESFTGANNTSGVAYGFWSGFVGDLFIFGTMVTFYKKHNCHQQRCWRVGKHVVDGTPYCSKHHMDKREYNKIKE